MKTTLKKITVVVAVIAVMSLSFISCEEGGISGPKMDTYTNVTLGNQYNPKGMYINFSTGKVYTPQEAFQKQSEIHFAYYYLRYSGTATLIISPTALHPYIYMDWDRDAPGGDFYYNTTYGFNKWTVHNKTEVGKAHNITEGEFNNIATGNDLLQAIGDGIYVFDVELDPSVGEVFTFITPEGKKGLFLVKKVTGTKYDSGEMVIDIKVIR